MDARLAQCEPIITNRATWFARRGLIDFEDAHQLGWVYLLELCEAGEYNLNRKKDINEVSVRIRNKIYDYVRKEIKHRGINQEGKYYCRILYNPLSQTTKPIEEIVHIKLLSSLLLNEILPIVPTKYTDMIFFCAIESETPRWQYEYAQVRRIPPKTVNNRMRDFRRRLRELLTQYYELKHSQQPIRLRYYKPKGGVQMRSGWRPGRRRRQKKR